MTQHPIAETEIRQIGLAAPKCVMRWAIDPATGKPVARWAVERPEMEANLALRAAA
jgi:hypothetical protein